MCPMLERLNQKMGYSRFTAQVGQKLLGFCGDVGNRLDDQPMARPTPRRCVLVSVWIGAVRVLVRIKSLFEILLEAIKFVSSLLLLFPTHTL